MVPLVGLDNSIATSHIGATTYESSLRMGILAAEKALQVLGGGCCP
jgi:phosphoglycerate dehydrogenase-like enzyme